MVAFFSVSRKIGLLMVIRLDENVKKTVDDELLLKVIEFKNP
jgi:hypothetical protein